VSNSQLESFFLEQKEPFKNCLFALRDIILKQHHGISETVKYGMPCYLYGSKPLFYLWKDKKTSHPYVLFVDGLLLDDPILIQGERTRMKIMIFDPSKDIPISKLEELLQQALSIRQKST
jgi:hypothetical protein